MSIVRNFVGLRMLGTLAHCYEFGWTCCGWVTGFTPAGNSALNSSFDVESGNRKGLFFMKYQSC